MYAVEVRDRIMIAHSFRGEMFGPAQALHGATFVIDAAFLAATLDPNGVVIDIGAAHTALNAIVKDLNYRNLDDIPEFGGFNPTRGAGAQRFGAPGTAETLGPPRRARRNHSAILSACELRPAATARRVAGRNP